MQDDKLKLEEGRVYTWSEIQQLGFNKNDFIKNRIPGHISMMDQLVFQNKTYTVGMTFELIQSTKKFKAIGNGLNADQVHRHMTIRRIEHEIEEVENAIWTWKFDFTVPEKIPPLEAKLAELRAELLNTVKSRV